MHSTTPATPLVREPAGRAVHVRALLLVLGAIALGATLEGDSAPPSDDALVSRVFAGVAGHVRAYEATRRLTAANSRTHSDAWLEVRTSLDPERGFDFEVLAEGGHRFIRTRVLREALTRERDLHRRRRLPSGALTAENYELREPVWRDDGLIHIVMVPR